MPFTSRAHCPTRVSTTPSGTGWKTSWRREIPGDASGGANGLGGTSAAAGYTNGTASAGTFLELPGSRTPGALLDSSATGLTRTSTNSDEAGVHVFPIR